MNNNKNETTQLFFLVSFVCISIFFISASSDKISSNEGFKIEPNDSVRIYEIKMDTLLSERKFLRLQLFDRQAFIEDDQTLISYNYCNSKEECNSIVSPKMNKDRIIKFPNAEITGQIVKPDSHWMHPPRSEYFRILELNAYPYFVKNKKEWSYDLNFGEHWGDERWITWEGRRTSYSTYKLGNTKVDYDLGKEKIKCSKIIAHTKIEGLGKTKSIFYYNEEYGFVYMSFKTINNQIIEFKML